MKPEQVRRNPAFTVLSEETAENQSTCPGNPIPSISRMGINLYFPPRVCEDYLGLLSREIHTKESLFSTKGPVASLWFRGYPLRQLSTDGITELVFRLCSRFNLKNNQGVDRGIHLGPEHCDRNTLALLKGLGFEVIRLTLDASIAGPDRSVGPVSRALEIIGEFSGLRLQCELCLGADTDPVYLDKVLALLVSAAAEEIELIPSLPAISTLGEQRLSQQTLDNGGLQLQQHGYLQFGENCFKRPCHGDIALRDNHRLCYGPWGFYNRDIVNWLGLGAAAEGISGGYLYHNMTDPDRYRHRVLNRLNPLASWSSTPLAEQDSYRLIQSLYCYHHIDSCKGYSNTTVKKLEARGWITRDQEQSKLTEAGTRNLGEVFQALISNLTDDQPRANDYTPPHQ